MTTTEMVEERWLCKKDVAAHLQCSTRHVESMVKAGRLPAPVYLGQASPRWHMGTLTQHLLQQQAGHN